MNFKNIRAALAAKTKRTLSSKPALAGIVASGLIVGGLGFTASADAATPNIATGLNCTGCVWQTQIADPVEKVLRTPLPKSVWNTTLNDNIVSWNKLSPAVRDRIDANNGTPGKSAYQIAVANGFVGTETEWLASLQGTDGTNGTNGTNGVNGVAGVESDGPYPGATKLQDYPGNGSNSTEKVPGDEGADSHTVWVKCAEGKTAIGGGFRLAADASLAAKKALQVVASEPMGDAIAGDAAGSILPTGWQVEVINNSTSDVIVRPWVVCANVAN